MTSIRDTSVQQASCGDASRADASVAATGFRREVNISNPVIGQWYRRPDRPELFHVIAFEGSAGEVDIEYSDGTLDEWPLSRWYELQPRAAAPQDWRGPLDCGSGTQGEGESDVDAAAAREPVEAAGDELDRDLQERLAQDVAILRQRHRAALHRRST